MGGNLRMGRTIILCEYRAPLEDLWTLQRGRKWNCIGNCIGGQGQQIAIDLTGYSNSRKISVFRERYPSIDSDWRCRFARCWSSPTYPSILRIFWFREPILGEPGRFAVEARIISKQLPKRAIDTHQQLDTVRWCEGNLQEALAERYLKASCHCLASSQKSIDRPPAHEYVPQEGPLVSIHLTARSVSAAKSMTV